MKARVSEETTRGVVYTDKTCRQWPMRNLKEAGIESVAQTKANLRKAGSVGEEATTTETQYPIRKRIKY
jgi:hypothetical protein